MFKNTTIKVVRTTLMKLNIFYVSENEMFRDTTVSQPAASETIVFVVFICGKQHAPPIENISCWINIPRKKNSVWVSVFGLRFGFRVWGSE